MRKGRGLDSWDSLDAVLEIAKERRAAGRVVAREPGIYPHHQQMFRRISEVDVLKVVNRPSQQSGAYQQRKRKRKLESNQASTPARSSERSTGAALFLEDDAGVGPSCLP